MEVPSSGWRPGPREGHAPQPLTGDHLPAPASGRKCQSWPRISTHMGLSFPSYETGTARLTCDVHVKDAEVLGLVGIRGPVCLSEGL